MRPLTILEFENEYETGAFVLDFRNADQFTEYFIPGSYYMNQKFIESAISKEIIPVVENIVIVAQDKREANAANLLDQLGYNNISGWLKGGFETWQAHGSKLDVVISIEADELMMDMKYDNPQVIDMRSEEAFAALHLEGAENIPPENLIFNLEELPKEGTYYLYCEDGELSLSIISVLKAQGFHNFYHVRGGFKSLLQFEAKMVIGN